MKSQTQLILSSRLHVIFGPKRIEEKFSEISLGKLECHRGCKGFLGGSAGKESACNAGDLDWTPGLGRSPGEENGNPLHYSCLENPMPTVHGVTKSRTQLRD